MSRTVWGQPKSSGLTFYTRPDMTLELGQRTRTIRCPHHHTFERFIPGNVLQPYNSERVRYPCGHIEGEQPIEHMPPTANTEALEHQIGILREKFDQLSRTRTSPRQMGSQKSSPVQTKQGPIDA